MRNLLYSFPVKLVVLLGVIAAAALIIQTRALLGLNRDKIPSFH